MGNVTLAREDARAQWIAPWVDSVWQDGMYALRMFRRAPVFTGAFVLVMALGVGATTAVFALVDSLVLRDLPVSRPDRLAYFSAPSFSYPIFTEVQARSTDVLASVAAWSVEDEYVAWTHSPHCSHAPPWRWRAPDSTGCSRTPSPARRGRSDCGWRSAHTRVP
jgi:hypothetical protein